MDVGSNKLYWAVEIANEIRRASLDGTNGEIIASVDVERSYGVALDLNAGKIYWIDSPLPPTTNRRIERAHRTIHRCRQGSQAL